jgi:hypothetical protein
MDKDMPADWAIERAIELVNVDGSTYTHESLTQNHIVGWSLGKAFARYIEAHEQPPVDPDLVTAREICAKVTRQWHETSAENRYLKGLDDNDAEVQFALAKLKEARGK